MPGSLTAPDLGMLVEAGPKDVLVLDIETQRSADEVGGWANKAEMGFALAVTWSEKDGFIAWYETHIHQLVARMMQADQVVGYNTLGFDYKILAKQTGFQPDEVASLDLCNDLFCRTGMRISLDNVCQHTLNSKKSGNGLKSIEWYRAGRLDLVAKYCQMDVLLTRELYRYGKEQGVLKFQSPKGTSIHTVLAPWASLETLRRFPPEAQVGLMS